MKRKEIEQLQAAGLISAEQAVAIAEHFHLNGGRRWNWLVLSMSTLAGGLILGGIIMLISANWRSIPDLVKMVVAMVLLLGFWVAWARTREKYPRIAEGLGLVGAGMWLGCISLYGQIFQLQNPFAEGCLLFFLGICTIPFLVRLPWLMVVVAVTSAVLLAALMHNTESWCSLKPWLNEDCTQFTAWGLLCLAWWLAAEHWRGSRGFYRDYSELGVPAMLFYLMLVQVPLLYTCIWPEDEAVLAKLLVLLPLVLLLRPRDICWGIWWQMVVLLSLPLPVGFMLCDARVELPGVLCGFAMGGWLMYLGYAAKRISWLNYGSLMVVFAGIALIANVLDSLTGSGLVLIIAGLLMLGLVWVLEKQRRALVGAIREKA